MVVYNEKRFKECLKKKCVCDMSDREQTKIKKEQRSWKATREGSPEVGESRLKWRLI